MKNYKEIADSVFDRREQYEIKKKKTKKMLTHTLTPICCVCLIALFGFGAWKGGLFDKQPISITGNHSSTTSQGDEIDHNSTVSENTQGATSQPPQKDEKPNSLPNGEDRPNSDSPNNDSPVASNSIGGQCHPADIIFTLKANKITSTAVKAKLYFDPALYDQKTLTEKETMEYLGIDFSKFNITDVSYRGVGVKNIITDKAGKVAYDTFAISYGDNITILASKIGLPYDCLYELDNQKESTFYTGKEKKQTTAVIGTDDKGFYFADFRAGGIRYRVKMENCADISDIGIVVKAVMELSVQ